MEATKTRRRLLELARTIGLGVILAMSFRIAIAQAYVVDGASMEPTLTHGERLVVARMAYGLSVPLRQDSLITWALPYPGDLVILRSPQDDVDLVKRVVGLPGDVVEWRSGVLHRNGAALATAAPRVHCEGAHRCWLESAGQRTYTVQHSSPGPGHTAPAVRVPPGMVYVVGDHRDRSNDSRWFGPVPSTWLRGRVVW